MAEWVEQASHMRSSSISNLVASCNPCMSPAPGAPPAIEEGMGIASTGILLKISTLM